MAHGHRDTTVTAPETYWSISRRPLQILVFLLPLILAYEISLALVLRTDDGLRVNTVEAHRSLLSFFASFGIAPSGGLYLGGIVIVVVLLAWHVLARQRWRIDPFATGLMALEALVLALPLLVLHHAIAGGFGAPPPAFAALGTWSQMAISVGAGLYEELVFRMILIALVHTLLVDVGKVSDPLGSIISIAVSAAAFTWYHDLSDPTGGLSWQRVLFYLSAGVYFGAVYSLRGFGLVVAVHAIYDVILVLLPAVETGTS